jgi:hypothetical protein
VNSFRCREKIGPEGSAHRIGKTGMFAVEAGLQRVESRQQFGMAETVLLLPFPDRGAYLAEDHQHQCGFSCSNCERSFSPMPPVGPKR